MADSSDAENQHQLIPASEILHQDLVPHTGTGLSLGTTTPTPTGTGSGRGRGRGRGKKSLVWEHFTILNCSDNTKRACCNLCKQTFAYSDGSKVAGTSHLKRHITLASCPVLKSADYKPVHIPSTHNTRNNTPNTDSPDSFRPAKRKYRVSGFSAATFDHEQSLNNLAKMVILNDYPLHLVEQQGFLAFVESLQPRFNVHDSNAMEAEVLGVYYKEKQNLMQVFGDVPGRVSLTIGLWTTSQTLGYVELYGQFIDNEWRLNRRMLNFLMVAAPHSENALSEAIEASLNDWGLKSKLFTITLDNNCSSHDIYSANLRDHLNNKDSLMLKGQLFVVRCYAHVLNAVAQDVIASIHGIIYNIRESVKFIKASPSREEKFAEIALQLEIPSTKTLSLDTTTQWNTTYNMLLAALEYQQAFNLLETCDDNYNEAPSSEDWKKVEVACAFLKLLYDSANAITSTQDPTANIFFHEAWKIQLELKNAVNSEDLVVSGIAKEMHDKFDKYWKDCSLILAIAVVMDPRFKMKLVNFSFDKIYGSDSPRYVKMVDDAIHDLYNEYAGNVQPLPLTPSFVEARQTEVSVPEPVQEPVQESEPVHETEPVQESEPAQETEPVQESEVVQETEMVQETQLVQETEMVHETEMIHETELVQETEHVEEAVVETNDGGNGDENKENNEDGNNDDYNKENNDNVVNDGCENGEMKMEIDGEQNVESLPVPEPVQETEPQIAEPVQLEEQIAEPVQMEAEIEANNNVMIQTEDHTNTNNINENNENNNNNDEGEMRSDIQPAAPISSTGDGLLDFEIYLSEIAVNQPTKPELDLYLEETLIPRTQEFDILNWWKQNTFKFPTLAKMVRDVLAVPIAMTGTGASVFGTGGGNRVLDEYRSSLRPETLEAIFCAKDWLQYGPMTVQEAAQTPGSAGQSGVKMEY